MADLILYEIFAWAEAFLRFLPGRTGIAMRRLWFQRRFRKSGRISIETGCEFVFPQAISLNGMVGIGKNGYFSAEGGSIEVGDHSSFNVNVHINAAIGGAIRIGESCLIGPNVVMRTADHRYDNVDLLIRQQGHVTGDIEIEDDVWIGANVVILGGIRIGKGAVVGAGAVVTKDIPSMTVALGIPAEVVKCRGKELSEA